jgi:hypothetical protein
MDLYPAAMAGRVKSDARRAEHNAFIKWREIPLLFSGALTKKALFLDGH